MTDQNYRVAVIGAGPAGLFAARELAKNGAEVSLFNRDIKPGGLAEYGIYPDKHAMKDALRNQFRQILETANIFYFGNLRVGQNGDLTLQDLRDLGYQAVLVTVGAQGTKKLGLPGEALPGVYHAKDLVYHYNALPPYSQRPYPFGKRVAVVGAGNVMMDIARFLVQKVHVQEVCAIVRRGPMEVKFDKKETEELALNMDLNSFDADVERIAEGMRAVGQDPTQARDFIDAALPNAHPTGSNTRFRFRFLSSPAAILGDESGVRALLVDDTELTLRDGQVGVRQSGRQSELPFDNVVFAIGDTVDESFGLPLEKGEYAKNPNPAYPQENTSFEAFDPATGQPLDGIFVAGWARQASTGLVGYARKDGTLAARAVLQYLQGKDPLPSVQPRLQQRLIRLTKTVVTNSDILKLDVIERDVAAEKGLRSFKFGSNQEMLEKIMSIG